MLEEESASVVSSGSPLSVSPLSLALRLCPVFVVFSFACSHERVVVYL